VALRVIVADDNRDFVSELVAMLSATCEIIATATDGQSALECIRTLQPDVAVIDLSMPELNGIEVARKATCCPPRTAVVICSVETDPEIVEQAFKAGAIGYVFKSRITADLVTAVQAAAAGQRFTSQYR
jgi:two-component system response regulator NreC